MLKKIVIIIFVYAFMQLPVGVDAGQDFAPWNADTAVGDEAVKWRIEHGHSHHGNPSIYNGMQGGAFILIRFFQVFISPQDGPTCRYRPVCSAYGKRAVEKHGALLGAMMAGERILRCNPYSKAGDDPVPHSLSGD